MSAGYAHPLYAASLAEFGQPIALPGSGGSLLRRVIAGTDLHDATAPYPLLGCASWHALGSDLAGLDGLVSVVAVPDPLRAPGESELRRVFPDLVVAFKRHYLTELAPGEELPIDAHHLRSLRSVPERLAVERLERPGEELLTWSTMYARLADRHEIHGVARFSERSFAAQFSVPGIVAYRAVLDGATVGMALWFRDAECAWYHLAASDERGYRAGSAYALVRRALEDFRDEGVAIVDLGGAAGLRDDADDGLARFKRGWSNASRTAYLCGRIVDADAYRRLAGAAPASGYFPAYRRSA